MTVRGEGARVTVYENGPLLLRGRFTVEDQDGKPVVTARTVALCRCGRTALPPWCDGNHKAGKGAPMSR